MIKSKSGRSLKEKQELLTLLLENEKRVAEVASKSIIFSPPLIERDSIPIIRRGTINLIQGRAGAHKSRLAQTLCSLMITLDYDSNDYLGFQRVEDEAVTVCFIDTERNIAEEFPDAVQNMKKLAGYSRFIDLPDFRFTSLKNIVKDIRLWAVESFIESVRESTNNPLFVVLDVATDCVENFNDPTESMQLLDYLGKLCDDYGATVLIVIHENPGTDKARGHLGTEAVNKASTVMHIGFEAGRNRTSDGNLIQLKFIKLRHSHLLPPISLVFSEKTKSLVLASPSQVVTRKPIDELNTLRKKLGEYLTSPLSQQELLRLLKNDLDLSPNTIKTRLRLIMDEGLLIPDEDGVTCKLIKKEQKGKASLYELVEEKSESTEESADLESFEV